MFHRFDPFDELYNPEDDPNEMGNLSAEHPDMKFRLKERLKSILRKQGAEP